MTCNHDWCYSDGKRGSAPYDDGYSHGGTHVVDLHCKKCDKTGVEIYTFEGFEESK